MLLIYTNILIHYKYSRRNIDIVMNNLERILGVFMPPLYSEKIRSNKLLPKMWKSTHNKWELTGKLFVVSRGLSAVNDK